MEAFDFAHGLWKVEAGESDFDATGGEGILPGVGAVSDFAVGDHFTHGYAVGSEERAGAKPTTEPLWL